MNDYLFMNNLSGQMFEAYLINPWKNLNERTNNE